jgi:hypothetical protein
MKRKRGWLQIGTELVLSAWFLIALSACEPLVKVTVKTQCAPSAALSDEDTLPKGTKCMYVNGVCKKTSWCTC